LTDLMKGIEGVRRMRTLGMITSVPTWYVNKSISYPNDDNADSRWYTLIGVPRGSKNGSGASINIFMFIYF
jgi:hypothetical protein